MSGRELEGHAFLYDDGIGLKVMGAVWGQGPPPVEAALRAKMVLTPIRDVADIYVFHQGVKTTLAFGRGALEWEWPGGGIRITPGNPEAQEELREPEMVTLDLVCTITITRSQEGRLHITIEEE